MGHAELILSPDILLALTAFAFATSITPGPNNLMLLASGVNFGLWRTVPHMLGIGSGFMLMVVLVGLGFSQVAAAIPRVTWVIKAAGTAYMLWLAWKIAHSGTIGEGRQTASPMTFLQAAAFQWVNPKAWAMAVTAIGAYTLPDQFNQSILIVALVFGVINLPSVSIWALFGVWLRRYLSNPVVVRRFNIGMALLLVLSLWPVAVELINRFI